MPPALSYRHKNWPLLSRHCLDTVGGPDSHCWAPIDRCMITFQVPNYTISEFVFPCPERARQQTSRSLHCEKNKPGALCFSRKVASVSLLLTTAETVLVQIGPLYPLSLTFFQLLRSERLTRMEDWQMR